MTNPAIPDRTFVDDFGRRWEWCGGTPDTWAWRITDYGDRWMTNAIQAALLATYNTLGSTVIGPTFVPLDTSPVPDTEVADMLADIAKAIPPCSRCGQPLRPGQWIASQDNGAVTHMHCPEVDR